MVARKRSGRKRFGGAAFETALVLIPLMSLILGVFEYGRLLMDWNVLNNAAREGCRYALVNNTAATINSDVTQLVTNYMGGQDANFSGFSVTVSGTSNGVATPVNNLAPGDRITVTVSGSYKFMNNVPIIKMPSTLSLSSSVTMVCEGGT